MNGSNALVSESWMIAHGYKLSTNVLLGVPLKFSYLLEWPQFQHGCHDFWLSERIFDIFRTTAICHYTNTNVPVVPRVLLPLGTIQI